MKMIVAPDIIETILYM